MPSFVSSFYGDWRQKCAPLAGFHEGDSAPPERLVQALWHHQRLLRDRLVTGKGEPVHVLHPGFWNREAGPDFRSAVLQFGTEIRVGDVEVDLSPAEWRGHGHDRNPNFRNVILHVVWDGQAKGATPPTLAIKSVLDAPVDELVLWLGSEAAAEWPEQLAGQCSARLKEISVDKLPGLLKEAAFVRFQRKAHEFEARARQAGWEQALWEGLFRVLGYKQNVWPMRRVAELLPRLRAETATPLAQLSWQAVLLGISGLLPAQGAAEAAYNDHSHGAGDYVGQLWSIWWRERETFSDVGLPKSVWRFNGLRPANRPERRLAVAATWLASERLLPSLEKWFTSELRPAEAPRKLQELLNTGPESFWSRHWTFNSPRFPKPQPLIGDKRITDLAVNAVLPWFWMRAVAGQSESMQRLAEQRYFLWPAAEDNAVLRLARHRLLGTGNLGVFRTAAAQQGLLQIVDDFCEQSNALCSDCRFPDLVRQWSSLSG